MSQATLSHFPALSAASPAPKAAARRHVRTDRWTIRHLAAAGVMAALAVLATRDAWTDILRHALKDQEYSHIWLVPVVAFFMVYVRRLRIRRRRSTRATTSTVTSSAPAAISAATTSRRVSQLGCSRPPPRAPLKAAFRSPSPAFS